MKKLLNLLCLFAVLASSCSREELLVDEAATSLNDIIFTAGFEQDTRTYIQDGTFLRWNEGDQISIFVANTLNRQYKFDGETGDNGGTFSVVDAPFGTGNDLACHYAVYPYAAGVKITEKGVVTTALPAEQSYAENSFGLGANTMVAVTKDTDDTFLKFKNVCGYIMLQLYGENITVKSITLTGNNDEKLAGKATVTPLYGQEPTIAMSDDATTSITLNCGDGVKLGTSAETATAFWIVIPPTTFDEGFEITVTDVNGNTFTKTTSKEVAIERNVIKPMAAFEVGIDIIPNNQIWYTSNDGQVVKPYNSKVFGANIVSNTYENGKGVIKFDGNVTTIGANAFLYCSSLTSVTIPDCVTSIGNYAFHDCGGLTSITIPDSVISIGNYAFRDCDNMTSISIGKGVTTIGTRAFWNCIGELIINSKIVETNYPTHYSKSEWLEYSEFTSLTIGDNIEIIGDYTFCYCSSLESITIPDNVKSIGKYAFIGCNNLANISIGKGVTLIKDGAFQWSGGDYSPRSVYISDISAWCRIDFTNSTSTPLDGGANLFLDDELVSEIVIPSDITEIKEYTFSRCESLMSITIPNSVTSIGDWAFSSCSSLTSITIGDSVTSIGYWAFSSCWSLTSITIGDSVTSIGDYAFYNCTSLTSITIPDGVTSIGRYAFYDCTSLTSVYCKPTTPPTGGYNMFYGCTSGLKIYVPAASVNAYKSAEYWSDYADCIFADQESIPNNEIWYTSSDGQIVKPFNNKAFGTNIISNTYENGKGIITFDGDVTSIGVDAFNGCSSLTSITIPDGVTSIGQYAFSSCSSLTSVTIPDSVTAIDGGAFLRCTSLTSITIPDGVTSIGNSAFWGCSSLTSVTIPNSVTEIRGYAFTGCRSLTSITIPDSVTSIGERAFVGCRSLTSITIGDSVTSIGVYAFSDCSSLTSVYCKPTTPPTGGDYMFYENASGRKIYVPRASVEAYKSAGYWSSYASDIVGYDF